ncbi:MAG: cytochrome C [Betaproteobacteria bacterium]|nr:cytochrome C [Betaproteobacteria bacterium]
MHNRIVVAVLLAASALPAAAQGTNPNLGRNLAATCANCHNTTGRSVIHMPSIAGMSRGVMLNHLKEFREGKRPATVMHQIAKGYTDAQLESIAAFYAAQK